MRRPEEMGTETDRLKWEIEPAPNLDRAHYNIRTSFIIAKGECKVRDGGILA
jgi:hypothetical protein